MGEQSQLIQALKTHCELESYRNSLYMNMIQNINTRSEEIFKDDMGTQFVSNCTRDLAGEVVRNYFDTSDYYLTVDQLAERIIKFDYENEYDPLKDNSQIRKDVYNYNNSSHLDEIVKTLDETQVKLFDEDRSKDSLEKSGIATYRKAHTDENGDIYDELTGKKGTTTTVIINGKEVQKSNIHTDHKQSRESLKVNERYNTEQCRDALKEYMNSSENFQMMHASANTSKGDIRVCEVNGKIVYLNPKDSNYDPKTDITHRATPEQQADAVCKQWEKETKSGEKAKVLKEQGYLDENGKVPKAVRKKLEDNIRRSQNGQSKIILKDTLKNKTNVVAKDAAKYTKKSMGKILAGQIIYYTTPPIIFELSLILKNKKANLDQVLEQLKSSMKRIGNYVFEHLKEIFAGFAKNSIKEFIKQFMDILINLVLATVKKMLKLVKNVVLASVDAISVLCSKGKSASEKADAVVNLFGITITNFALDILFEYINKAPIFPDWLLQPLQILASVICTNLTILVLQKADLFDTRFGFRINKLREMFEEERANYINDVNEAEEKAYEKIDELLAFSKLEIRNTYNELLALNPSEQSVRGFLEKINNLFAMKIDFENDWSGFLGVQYNI